MATSKSAGSTKNGRDSNAKRRGIKIYAGQKVNAGTILVRQVGTRIYPGLNVGMGRDFTIFAKIQGVVRYERMGKDRRRVTILPA